MARKSGYISIIQFDEHLITRLRIRRSSKKVEVAAYDQLRGDWTGGGEALQDALTGFVKEHRISSDKVCSVLPRHNMTARIINLPTHDIGEIRSMVELSADEYVPFPPEELVIDQCVLERAENNQSRVMAVLAHRDVVVEHLRVLGGAGVEPENIFVSSACLASAMLALYPQSESPLALMNLGSEGIEALVVGPRGLEYTRGVATVLDWSLGSGNSEDILEELALETRGTLGAFRRESEHGLKVERVLVSSDFAEVEGICSDLSMQTERTCEASSIAHSLIGHGADKVPENVLTLIGAAMTAQGTADVVINLTPESLVDARAAAKVKRSAVSWAVLTVAIMASIMGVFYQKLDMKRAYLNELQSDLVPIQQRARDAVAKRKQLEFLQQEVDRSDGILEILSKVFELCPSSGLTITAMEFRRDMSLDISGLAVDRREPDMLAVKLRNAAAIRPDMELFDGAHLVTTSQSKEFGKVVWQFSITVPLFDEDSEE